MADESAPLAVILLCGIPGSGKTTLSTKLREYLKKVKRNTVHLIHVSFDDLIPSDLTVAMEVDIESTGEDHYINSVSSQDVIHFNGSNTRGLSKYTLWKAYRKRILESVGKVLGLLENKNTEDERFELEMDGLPSFEDFWNKFTESICHEERNCSCCTKGTWRWTNVSHVILVDDNMFYHSMRYEYLQLARKYSIGFAEVFMECPLEIAKKRNKLRNSEVTTDTIKAMVAKMEPPEPNKFTWEKFNLTVNSSKEVETGTMERIMMMIEDALNHPIPPIPKENCEEKETSRVACLTNITHQADQVVRKCIAGIMEKAKSNGEDKKQLQQLAVRLNKERKELLNELRNIKHHSNCSDQTKDSTFQRAEAAVTTRFSGTEKTGLSSVGDRDISAEGLASTVSQQRKNPCDKGMRSAVANQHVDQHLSSESYKLCSCVSCCLPDLEAKDKFKLFVEELFKGKLSSCS